MFSIVSQGVIGRQQINDVRTLKQSIFSEICTWKHHEEPQTPCFRHKRDRQQIWWWHTDTHWDKTILPAHIHVHQNICIKNHLSQMLWISHTLSIYMLLLLSKCYNFDSLPTSPPKNITCSIIIELGILYQPLHHFKKVLPGVVRIHVYNSIC